MKIVWIVLGVLVVAIVAGYWYATGGLPDREAPGWLGKEPIAHKGLWTEGPERPENSLAAFDAAARQGYGIELDVQLSADGTVVVFHDEDLKRMTGEEGRLGQTSLAKLRRLRLLGGDEKIPTLEQALRLIDGRVPVLVEVKNPDKVGALEDETARAVAAYDGEASVQSFNPFSLARIGATKPEIVRGQLSKSTRGFKEDDLAFYEVFLLSNLLLNWKSRPDYVAYDVEGLPSNTTRIQRMRGRPLVGWTIKSESQLADASALCDAVICDPQALTSE